MDDLLHRKKLEAKYKALDSLSRYKFMNFGYWAAIWVHLNKMSDIKEPNPFYDFVHLALQQRQRNPIHKEKEDKLLKSLGLGL